MSRFIYVGPSELGYAVRFPQGLNLTAAAENAEPEFGTIEIDDPGGTLTPVPLNSAYIVETAASPTRLWTGYIGNLTIVRQYSSITGAGRVWSATCVDQNWNLVRRVVLSKDGYRPAETDLARVTWLMANPVTAGLVYSGVYTNTSTNAINVDEADYRWMSASQILADFTPTAGKRAFAFYNSSTGNVELFYDQVTAATYSSTAKISNVNADLGAGVYEPMNDATFDREGSEIFSKVVLVYKGTGVVTAENLTTKSTYGENTFVYTSSRIGKLATATSVANQFLSDHAAPIDTITCRVILPAANVNDILEGQRVQIKFSHFPGVTSYTYWRVTRRLIEINDSDDYLVTLALSNQIRKGVPGGPGPGGNFPPPAAAPTIVQSKFALTSSGAITLNQTPTTGNYLVMGVASRGTSITLPAGWTEHSHGQITPGSDFGRLAYRAVSISDTATIPVTTTGATYACVWEVSGILGTLDTSSFADVDTTVQPATFDSGTLTPTAGLNAIMFAFGVVHCSDWAGNGATTMSTPSGWTLTGKYEVTVNGDLHPNVLAVTRTEPVTAGSYGTSSTLTGAGFNFGGWGGLAFVFGVDTSSVQPTSGQQLEWATVTVTPGATTTTGTTLSAYAGGTLEIKVNGLIISASSYTETNPATGAFTLNWVLDTDEVVQVRYVAR